MSIRRAVPADLPAIMTIERAASTAAHWSEPHYATALRHADYLALVAEESAEPAGFLIARAAGPEWELENVVVTAGSQRRGLGAALVAELLRSARAHGASAVFLEVRESNTAARRLYEGAGFAVSGRRSAYYHGPAEDAMLYRFLCTPEPCEKR